MVALGDFSYLNGLFNDFPFEHELTDSTVFGIKNGYFSEITGFCSASVIDGDPSAKLFFRAGFDGATIVSVKRELNILMKLQCYDFVPRVIDFRQFGRYYVLFTELLNATSIDLIDPTNKQVKLALKEALRLLHKLYCEIGFLHKDLHFGNIMITPDNKVYLIDFTTSTIPDTLEQRLDWTRELTRFINVERIYNRTDDLDKLNIELSTIKDNHNPELYLKYIEKIENIIFP